MAEVGTPSKLRRKTTVLFIDDDEMLHELIRHYATGTQSIETTHALTLGEGLEHLENRKFDLVMVDNRLRPHEDYLFAAGAIRDAGFTGSLVVMSGDTSHPVFAEFSSFGVQQVVDKSCFNLDTFSQQMQQLSSLSHSAPSKASG